MTPTFLSGSTHFTVEEVRCKCGCGLLKFHPGFIEKLEQLRKRFNRGMIVNSAMRCKAHNDAIGGHPRSLHVGDFPFHDNKGCMAVDIKAYGQYRGDLYSLAWENGWSIGEGDDFLHLDWRMAIGMPQTVFKYGA